MDRLLEDEGLKQLCRLEWGAEGARRGAARRDAVVIVDTLRFSTTVIALVERGAIVYPESEPFRAELLARRVGGEVSAWRTGELEGGRFSLSPLSAESAHVGDRVILVSPNGANCCREAEGAPLLIAGALVNAGAVADYLIAHATSGYVDGITVIACGERSSPTGNPNDYRFALEDYLGAGAIISRLPLAKDEAADACVKTFREVREDVRGAIWDCPSGIELREKDFPADVEFAARLDVFDVVPIARDGAFRG